MSIINRKDEKLIRNFCKKVKNNLKESKHIQNEVEEELFENIKAKALSLVNENVTPSMAVKLALDEYESPKSVLEELSEEYKVKKTINNKFLSFSILLFFVSAVILSGFYYWNIYLIQKDFDRATMDVDILAVKQMGNESALPYLVTENPTIEAIWTTISNEKNKDRSTYVFPENLNLGVNMFERTDNIFYETVFHGYVSDIGNKNFQIEMNVAQVHLKSTIFFIGALILLLSLSFFIYWVKDNIKYKYSNKNVQTA